MALRLPAAIPAVFAEALVRVFKKAMGFVSWKASRWYDSEGHRRCAVDAEAAEEVLTAFDASKWQALSRSGEPGSRKYHFVSGSWTRSGSPSFWGTSPQGYRSVMFGQPPHTESRQPRYGNACQRSLQSHIIHS